MRATIPYIEQKFSEFNTLCFGGELPPLPIQLSNARSFLGKLVFYKRRTIFGKIERYDYRLRISTRINLPEKDIEDAIIHEMIHYHIALNDIPDTSAHGPAFRRIMNYINVNYGRNVRLSYRLTAEQREEAIDKRERYHAIAVVTLADGGTAVKVLPLKRHRIITYYNSVSRAREVTAVRLYLSKNAYFNRYPCSSALRVYSIDKDVLEQHLQDAWPVSCDGDRITY